MVSLVTRFGETFISVLVCVTFGHKVFMLGEVFVHQGLIMFRFDSKGSNSSIALPVNSHLHLLTYSATFNNYVDIAQSRYATTKH